MTEQPIISANEPKIVQKDAFLVAGLRYAGKNQNGEIPALWQNDFMPHWAEFTDIKLNDNCYGVCRCLAHISPDAGFEYLAAFEVNSFDNLPDGVVGWEIPAQTYIVMQVNGLENIGSIFDSFYKEWLPNSKDYARADGPDFEFYPESFCRDQILYIYFPVQHK